MKVVDFYYRDHDWIITFENGRQMDLVNFIIYLNRND